MQKTKTRVYVCACQSFIFITLTFFYIASNLTTTMHFSFLLSLLSTIVVMQNPLNQQKRKKNELNITEVKEKKKDQRVRLISKQMND